MAAIMLPKADKLAEASVEIDLGRSVRLTLTQSLNPVRATHRAVVVQEQWRVQRDPRLRAIIQEQAFDRSFTNASAAREAAHETLNSAAFPAWIGL